MGRDIVRFWCAPLWQAQRMWSVVSTVDDATQFRLSSVVVRAARPVPGGAKGQDVSMTHPIHDVVLSDSRQVPPKEGRQRFTRFGVDPRAVSLAACLLMAGVACGESEPAPVTAGEGGAGGAWVPRASAQVSPPA